MDKEKGEIKVQRIKEPLFSLHFDYFAPVVVALPLGALIFCFVTAMIFQFDEVNKTMCEVQNFIPSISAITGAAPQRYVWRTCIALHSTPRYAVGFVYYNYWMGRKHIIPEEKRDLFKKLVTVTLMTYTLENSCLLMVSFIGNFENYPLHEKIFVVFMFTSLFHQFFVVVLFKWAHPVMDERLSYSYKWKKTFFVSILVSTALLVFFFIQHRVFCVKNAFSWFSLAEYGIAVFNIGFHYSAKIDFHDSCWFIGARYGSNIENMIPTSNGNGTHVLNGSTTTYHNGDNKMFENGSVKGREMYKNRSIENHDYSSTNGSIHEENIGLVTTRSRSKLKKNSL